VVLKDISMSNSPSVAAETPKPAVTPDQAAAEQKQDGKQADPKPAEQK
jgi:cell division septation protein DedD